MKKYTIILFAILVIGISSCSKNEPKKHIPYKDGVYKSFSKLKDDWGGTAEVEIKVENGKIIECVFLSYEKDGKLKGLEYGKIDGIIKNIGLYNIAQNSVIQAGKYGQKLVESQNIDDVDVIAGATISHKLFKDAVTLALQDAKEGK